MKQYDQHNLPEGNYGEYRKVAITRAIQMDEEFEVVTIDGNRVIGQPGDFLCIDSHGHPYPCERFEFAAIYTPLEEREAA